MVGQDTSKFMLKILTEKPSPTSIGVYTEIRHGNDFIVVTLTSKVFFFPLFLGSKI